jgi:hypothetical protein
VCLRCQEPLLLSSSRCLIAKDAWKATTGRSAHLVPDFDRSTTSPCWCPGRTDNRSPSASGMPSPHSGFNYDEMCSIPGHQVNPRCDNDSCDALFLHGLWMFRYTRWTDFTFVRVKEFRTRIPLFSIKVDSRLERCDPPASDSEVNHIATFVSKASSTIGSTDMSTNHIRRSGKHATPLQKMLQICPRRFKKRRL